MKKQTFALTLLWAILASSFLAAQTNTATGTEALQSNTTGTSNSAFGFRALKFNTTGIGNTASGESSLLNNMEGHQNTAVGFVALNGNVSGNNNTACGAVALFSNNTGIENTAAGAYALYSNKTGNWCSAFGANSLANNTASNNTSVGAFSLYANTTGQDNTAIGARALSTNLTGSGNTASGRDALYANTSGSNNTATGMNALIANTTGSGNTAQGAHTLSSNSTGFNNTATGVFSLYSNTTGNSNVATGLGALYSNTSGSSNTAAGANALYYNTVGTQNAATGTGALRSNTSGSANTAHGHNALYENTSGNNNTSLGNSALKNNTTGAYNVATGSESMLSNTIGRYNNAHGYLALQTNTTGNYNAAFGHGTLSFARYSFNVGLGASAGSDGDNSNNCTYVGYDADNNLYGNAYTNSTALGNSARMTASNQVRIGNTSVTSIGGFQSWSNVSDGRYKNNVKENVPGLAFIRKLRPVTYNLDINRLAEDLNEDISDGHGEQNPTSADQATIQARKEKAAVLETGFIAQEVEAVAESLGYDFSGVDKPKDAAGLYALRYAEFTVPLVKAVQELDKENAELKRQNAKMMERLDALEQLLAAQNPAKTGIQAPASLKQNIPNPFGQSTNIECMLPEQASKVSLLITNENGSTVKEIAVTERGLTNITFSANTLSPGVYYYSLLVDGRKVDTKKMVLIK